MRWGKRDGLRIWFSCILFYFIPGFFLVFCFVLLLVAVACACQGQRVSSKRDREREMARFFLRLVGISFYTYVCVVDGVSGPGVID
jgi:hypothetical protein